jgi:hypothetical protein
MTGSKQVDHGTSGTMYECSEIAGSPHNINFCPNGQGGKAATLEKISFNIKVK